MGLFNIRGIGIGILSDIIFSYVYIYIYDK